MENTQREESTIREQRTEVEVKKPVIANSTLPPFDIIKQIHSGGESDIYLINHSGTERVLKVYRFGIAINEELVNKIKTLCGEDNKHFVYIIEIAKDPGCGKWYEIQKYYPGGNLKELIQKNQSKVSKDYKIILSELYSAITILHKNNIIHRDIKPQNILVDEVDGKVNYRLTDFGISKLSDGGMSKLQCTFAATYQYTAPETMALTKTETGYKSINTKKSDYWSLGMIMLECISGKHPFEGIEAALIGYTLMSSDLEIPNKVRGNERKLLEGLLNKNPDKRWGEKEILSYLSDFAVKTETTVSKAITTSADIFIYNQIKAAHDMVHPLQAKITETYLNDLFFITNPNHNRARGIITNLSYGMKTEEQIGSVEVSFFRAYLIYMVKRNSNEKYPKEVIPIYDIYLTFDSFVKKYAKENPGTFKINYRHKFLHSFDFGTYGSGRKEDERFSNLKDTMSIEILEYTADFENPLSATDFVTMMIYKTVSSMRQMINRYFSVTPPFARDDGLSDVENGKPYSYLDVLSYVISGKPGWLSYEDMQENPNIMDLYFSNNISFSKREGIIDKCDIIIEHPNGIADAPSHGLLLSKIYLDPLFMYYFKYEHLKEEKYDGFRILKDMILSGNTTENKSRIPDKYVVSYARNINNKSIHLNANMVGDSYSYYCDDAPNVVCLYCPPELIDGDENPYLLLQCVMKFCFENRHIIENYYKWLHKKTKAPRYIRDSAASVITIVDRNIASVHTQTYTYNEETPPMISDPPEPKKKGRSLPDFSSTSFVDKRFTIYEWANTIYEWFLKVAHKITLNNMFEYADNALMNLYKDTFDRRLWARFAESVKIELAQNGLSLYQYAYDSMNDYMGYNGSKFPGYSTIHNRGEDEARSEFINNIIRRCNDDYYYMEDRP